jgi:hypothetical protein
MLGRLTISRRADPHWRRDTVGTIVQAYQTTCTKEDEAMPRNGANGGAQRTEEEAIKDAKETAEGGI